MIITPMLSGPPPLIGSFPMDHGDVDLHWRRMTDFAPYAMISNVGGTPALSIPHGIDRLFFPGPRFPARESAAFFWGKAGQVFIP